MILKKVECLCKERGITISKLEKDCGLGNGTITKWNNSMPKIDTLKKVADYFNVPLEYFVTEGKE